LAGILTVLTLAAVVVVVVIVTGATDREPDAIILGTTLGNRHKHRLMVTRGRHSANTIVTSGKALLKGSSKFAIAVASVVDALEEGEGLGIERLLRVVVRADVLDSEVGVADNDATLESLWSGVVGVVWVSEGTGLEVGNADCEVN
jgi:hypothetical protein